MGRGLRIGVCCEGGTDQARVLHMVVALLLVELQDVLGRRQVVALECVLQRGQCGLDQRSCGGTP